jgi:hypothetical protein
VAAKTCEYVDHWGGRRPEDECGEPCVEGLVVCLKHAHKESMYLVIQTQAKELERLKQESQDIQKYFRKATKKFGW